MKRERIPEFPAFVVSEKRHCHEYSNILTDMNFLRSWIEVGSELRMNFQETNT